MAVAIVVGRRTYVEAVPYVPETCPGCGHRQHYLAKAIGVDFEIVYECPRCGGEVDLSRGFFGRDGRSTRGTKPKPRYVRGSR